VDEPELVLEVEVMLELGAAEVELEVLLPVVMGLLEDSAVAVLLVASLEVCDSVEAGVIEDAGVVELGTVTVPRVVGAVSVSALSVKLKVKVGRSKVCVIPDAVANTLVARSLAVPHPNW